MTIVLDPAEIFLIQRYASLDYFGGMRDHFAACVRAAEDALEAFMLRLPRNYRSLELWRQPDVVWGGSVIPNMRWALDGLNQGYIDVTHGDFDGIGACGNVSTTFASISRDYTADWMLNDFLEVYARESGLAWLMAMNINHTYYCAWEPGILTGQYDEISRGALNPPETWPIYRPSNSVRIESGQEVLISGVYLPAAVGCAQFLIRGQSARGAMPPDDPAVSGLRRRVTEPG
ncbi:hypothetical protein, partial [Rubrivivax gelatinosus]|uniref:hypothetical protein n=1 Tax=Rubrivivax gelatinosus TaxID=28068 RepID=UPI0019065909